MFVKYASNLLEHVSEECELRAYTLANDEDRATLLKIAKRIEWVVQQLAVEKAKAAASKHND